LIDSALVRNRSYLARVLLLILLCVFALASIRQAAAQPRDPVRVRLSLDTAGASIRVVLTYSKPISYGVARSDRRLDLLFSEPIRVEPYASEINDSVLKGWTQDGDRELALLLGPDFQRYESFELKNPSRLILDLVGRKPREGPVPGTQRPGKRRKAILVIDPGHGGVETGAAGPTGMREKDITLDLARRLKRLLTRDRNLSVVLTRDDDRLVDLDERTAVANHNRAHLFISIHLNSSRRKEAFGAETYYLSADATDNEARTLAALENLAYKADKTIGAQGGGRQKKALELILWDLAQNQYLAESSRLAESVQEELNVLTKTRNRGVRQAPFRVLMGATMPAILVEVGFISNPDEEAMFRSLQYRDRVAEAVARAVREFLRGRERLSGPGVPAIDGARP